MNKFILAASAIFTTALFSPTATAATLPTTLSCELGDDSYDVVLTPSDETWPGGNDPTIGGIRIVFSTFRLGLVLLGSYVVSAQVLKFAVTANGDPTYLVAGTISRLTAAHPILRVTKGSSIYKKNKDVPCDLK